MEHKLKLYRTKDKKTPQVAYIFHEVPVENVIIWEALSVKEVSDQLSQVGVVRLLLKPEGAHIVVVGGELGWKEKQKQQLVIAGLPPPMTRSDIIGISLETYFRTTKKGKAYRDSFFSDALIGKKERRGVIQIAWRGASQ